MAIDTGLLVDCGDLNAVGGIRQIILTELDNITTVAPTAAAADHIISSMVSSDPWARFEFKNETAALAITGTKEGGSTAYECALSFYIPDMTADRMAQLSQLEDACPVAIVEMNSGEQFIIGFSYRYENLGAGATPWVRNQTYANLTSIEGGTGSAYADDNGLTVTLTARQFELPFNYSGAITVVAGDLTATTS
mgnify:CR=1 FL=1